MVLNVELHSHHYRLGFISQWGALAGRYAALYPTGFPWSTTAQRMPFHSSNGKNLKSILDTFLVDNTETSSSRSQLTRCMRKGNSNLNR